MATVWVVLLVVVTMMMVVVAIMAMAVAVPCSLVPTAGTKAMIVLLCPHSLASLLENGVAHATLLGQRQRAGTFRHVQGRGEGDHPACTERSVGRLGMPLARSSRPVLDGEGSLPERPRLQTRRRRRLSRAGSAERQTRPEGLERGIECFLGGAYIGGL